MKTLPDELANLNRFETCELVNRTQNQLELLWTALTSADFNSGAGEREGGMVLIENCLDNLKVISQRLEGGA